VTTDKANISQGRKLSGIWIIPLLALALGAYMVIHTWMTEGPEITIAFKTADGLEQGKTKVKYRNVNMGLIEEVRLNDNLDGVVATVKLERQALTMLRDDTRFWVVTASIAGGKISGLGTLLSGAYIQLAPGTGKVGQRKFVALDKPPETPTGAPGLRLKLTTDNASSISTGDAVLFNRYKVGRVESAEFDPADRKLHYVIFIDAPYHTLVDSSVRFWDVSGVTLVANAEGVKLETGSLDTVLMGGIGFGTPPGINHGEPVEHNAEFKLYSSYDDILRNPFQYGAYYVVSFSQSIKGLLPGAPVEYRGIPLGRVERILLKESMDLAMEEDRHGTGDPIPVLLYLEPGRLKLPDRESSIKDLQLSIATGIANGMRASLESGNLLTGAKYIGIDYFADAEEAEQGTFLEYPTIPTIGTGLGQLEQKLTSILDKINDLPLDDTVTGANAALVTLNTTLANLNTIVANQSTQQLPAQLDKTLQQLRETIKGLSPDSEVYQSINSSLLRLNRTMGNMESLTRKLSGQPNSVLVPSSPTPDPIPEVRQ
jgi:paraquat-inducible protein B